MYAITDTTPPFPMKVHTLSSNRITITIYIVFVMIFMSIRMSYQSFWLFFTYVT